MRLSGKVAVITGAASGQGAVEAERFVEQGARVIATDVRAEPLRELVDRVAATHPDRIVAVEHDVTDEAAWQRVVREGEAAFGSINVLVNNAGILRVPPFTEIDFDEWNRSMTVNAWSQFVGIKTVIEPMRRAGGGSIVNIASIASRVNTDGFNAYGASKGAVEALTRSAADEFAKLGIRVNSIHPGEVATPMLFEAVSEADIAAREAVIPLGRLGRPDDIANLAVYLASDESSYMTGSSIVIDGGVSVTYV